MIEGKITLYYFWQDLLAYGFFLVPLLTLIWLVRLFLRSRKTHEIKKNKVLLLLLTVLLLGQFKCIYYVTYEIDDTKCFTEVIEIRDKYHIVIQNGEQAVTLKTSREVTSLVQTDGSVYEISYRWKKTKPEEGKLLYIRSEQDYSGGNPNVYYGE